MNGKTAAVLLSALLVACAQMPPPQVAASSASSPPPAPVAPTPPPAPAPSAVPATAPAQPPAAKSAPTDHIVNIREASCQNLLRLSPQDRAAASMFYIGYQASRLRARTINVGVIPSIEEQAISYCEENPDRTAAQAYANAYLRTRRR